MKNAVTIPLLILILAFNSYAQEIRVTDDIQLIKLTEHSYIHTSFYNSPKFGRFPSNGFLYHNNGRGYLFDTPMTNELTQVLVEYIKDSMHLEITGFVPTHWHNDCMGGLEYIHSQGIPSFGLEMTCDIAKEKGLPVPKRTFQDSLLLNLEEKSILCKYFGAGHSQDNIVVWVPSDTLLFGGCLVKALEAQRLGNLSDADVKEWPVTIEKLIRECPEVRYVIPGHGSFGDKELLKHTIDLTSDFNSN